MLPQPHIAHRVSILYLCLYSLVIPHIYSKLAAAAKLLQSCLTLHNPTDGSPPRSPFPGILQARTLEWVAISFSNIYLSEDLKYQALARL